MHSVDSNRIDSLRKKEVKRKSGNYFLFYVERISLYKGNQRGKMHAPFSLILADLEKSKALDHK